MTKSLLATLAVVAGLSACTHPARLSPRCGPMEQLALTVHPGANPTFSWSPSCAVGWVHVAPSGSDRIVWQIEGRDSTNAITAPLTYGELPHTAIQLNPVVPLTPGVKYTVSVGRFFDGNFNGTQRRVIIELAQEEFQR